MTKEQNDLFCNNSKIKFNLIKKSNKKFKKIFNGFFKWNGKFIRLLLTVIIIKYFIVLFVENYLVDLYS